MLICFSFLGAVFPAICIVFYPHMQQSYLVLCYVFTEYT